MYALKDLKLHILYRIDWTFARAYSDRPLTILVDCRGYFLVVAMWLISLARSSLDELLRTIYDGCDCRRLRRYRLA